MSPGAYDEDGTPLPEALAEVHRRARPAATLLFVYAGFVGLQLLAGIVIAAAMGPASYGLLDRIDRLMIPVQALLFLACAVVFVRWNTAAYKLLPALTGSGLNDRPAWVFWSYVVPILNFFRPYQLMREIWDGSDPTRLQLDLEANGRDGRWRIGVWWGLWLSGAVLNRVARFLVRDDPTHESLQLLQAGYVILIAAAGLFAALVVRSIDARQQARSAEVLAGDNVLVGPPSL